jgi:hypothetical protein
MHNESSLALRNRGRNIFSAFLSLRSNIMLIEISISLKERAWVFLEVVNSRQHVRED